MTGALVVWIAAGATVGPWGDDTLRLEPQGTLASTHATSPEADIVRTDRESCRLPPVDGAVTRLFDPPAHPWGAGHRGVDLAARPGTPVRSPAEGTITFAGTVVDRGVVTVQHADGLRSSLEPVAPTVDEGEPVHAGQIVGLLTERPSHPGLHWGVRDKHTYLDPLSLLCGTRSVVLLP